MSTRQRRDSAAVVRRLLAVLCAAAGCVAGQQQQQQSAPLGVTPSQVWSPFSQAIQAELKPFIDRLQSQIDAQDGRLVALDSQVDELTTLLSENNQTAQPDALVSRLNGQQSLLDTLIAKVDGQKSQTDELAATVDGQKSEQVELADRLTALVSKKDKTVSRLAVQFMKMAVTQVKLAVNQKALGASLKQLQGGAAPLPRDCSELLSGAKSGIHILQPGLDRSRPPVPAYCDLDTDGGNWTVIQRRVGIPPRQDFNLGWSAYREGFGELDAEFWWGLDRIWTMTSARDRRYELFIHLEDFEGRTSHAVYEGFRIASEADGYRLTVGNYSGDAGDSLRFHSSRQFSTLDRDHDTSPDSCAQRYKGAWWFGNCYVSFLNGVYLENPSSEEYGIKWKRWRGNGYSLKRVEMKIRPKNVPSTN